MDREGSRKRSRDDSWSDDSRQRQSSRFPRDYDRSDARSREYDSRREGDRNRPYERQDNRYSRTTGNSRNPDVFTSNDGSHRESRNRDLRREFAENESYRRDEASCSHERRRYPTENSRNCDYNRRSYQRESGHRHSDYSNDWGSRGGPGAEYPEYRGHRSEYMSEYRSSQNRNSRGYGGNRGTWNDDSSYKADTRAPGSGRREKYGQDQLTSRVQRDYVSHTRDQDCLRPYEEEGNLKTELMPYGVAFVSSLSWKETWEGTEDQEDAMDFDAPEDNEPCLYYHAKLPGTIVDDLPLEPTTILYHLRFRVENDPFFKEKFTSRWIDDLGLSKRSDPQAGSKSDSLRILNIVLQRIENERYTNDYHTPTPPTSTPPTPRPLDLEWQYEEEYDAEHAAFEENRFEFHSPPSDVTRASDDGQEPSGRGP